MATKRCTTCWHFDKYCTCVLDQLDAELPGRCHECWHFFDYCTCVERPVFTGALDQFGEALRHYASTMFCMHIESYAHDDDTRVCVQCGLVLEDSDEDDWQEIEWHDE